MHYSILDLDLIPFIKQVLTTEAVSKNSEEFLMKKAILKGDGVIIPWSTFFSESPNGDLYFVDKTFSVVKKIKVDDGSISIVSGIFNQMGYRDGDLDNVLFKNPSSVLYFKYNHSLDLLDRNRSTVIVVNSEECQHVDYLNYTACLDNLSLIHI
eukprot:TRINITY_DN20335_c0_g1_i1.p1 TRINITY_DN20335_c0_g1~~TRINITY_DN20335_c0_g1_i1.p1  ORF type:complete len:154 (-),score=17.02 TRINITY_DN20335_c0_g1_i1:33-494(-)